jgi:hypothetical protein
MGRIAEAGAFADAEGGSEEERGGIGDAETSSEERGGIGDAETSS